MSTLKVNNITPLSGNTVIISGSLVSAPGSSLSGSFTGSLHGTASYAIYALNGESTDTGSFLVTASVNSNTITFTKGDNTTFDITVDTGSAAVSIDTGSFATTGSNTFIGAQNIINSTTEALNLGSTGVNANQPVDIRLATTGNARGIRIYASSTELTTVPVAAGFQLFSTASTNFPGQVYFDSAAHNSASISFRTSQTGETLKERIKISSNGIIAITGSLRTTGSLFLRDLTDTAQSNVLTYDSSTGQVFFTASSAIGGGGGGTINTGSFATTGSNTFIGNQTISGSLNFGDGSQIQSISASSGDGNGYSTLQLKPDVTLATDQYIILDPTTPNHIHIRAGGTIDSSSAYLYLGGENNNVLIDDSGQRVQITSVNAVNINGALEQGNSVQAIGNLSHAEGDTTQAVGYASHAEGQNTFTGLLAFSASIASGIVTMSQIHGDVSFEYNPGDTLLVYNLGFDTINYYTIISSTYNDPNTILTLNLGFINVSQAYIGNFTQPNFNGSYKIPGSYSHAEGGGTFAVGKYTHAEGDNSFALGEYSHAEGSGTKARGNYSHAEGSTTQAIGDYSHAEGFQTLSNGNYSHAEGQYTTSSGDYSHAEGENSRASGQSSHSEGLFTIASGNFSHAEGSGSTASGIASHAEGNSTTANGNYAHAEGRSTTATGVESHAEGRFTTTIGISSHAEGVDTRTVGIYSHAEGESTHTVGYASHAEGYFTSASGYTSHAEGHTTRATATAAHAEGYFTIASGNFSHAEGSGSTASGVASHAAGQGTIAAGAYQSVIGQFNISSPSQSAFIIGNGIDNNNRSNLLFASGSQIELTGSLNISGSLIIPVTGSSLALTGSMYVDPANNKLWIYTGNGGVGGWVTASLG